MAQRARNHVDDPKAFGHRLRRLRGEAGLSQRELAFPGCSSAYISRIESGERVPSLQVIHEFARRLRISPVFLATGVEDDEEESELLSAELALRLGEIREARRVYRRRLGADPNDPDALAGLGAIALRENHPVKAIALLEQALESRTGRLLECAGTVETLARAYALGGALDAAIALLEQALAEAEEASAQVEILRFRVLLANALIDTGQFQHAEQVLARALASVAELGDPLATARIYWSQARLHTHNRNPRLGIRYARRAIEILERTENDAYVATAYHLLAYAHIEAGRPDTALEQLERGRELFGAALTDRDDAKFALEETRALTALRRTKAAAAKAAQALAKLDALDPLERGRSYMLLGDVLHASGDRERALELYELALELLGESGRSYVLEAARRVADVLEELDRPEQALAVLKRGLAAGAAQPTAAAEPTTAPTAADH
jgi:tetratricopeptide (TPR) repeat protein